MMTCCVSMHNIIVKDEGEDATTALEIENLGDHVELLDQIPPHLKSLFKCINKFGIEQLTSS